MRSALVLLALTLTGCECGSEAPRPRATGTEAAAEPTSASSDGEPDRVPSTARTDLPEATPTVLVTAEPRGFRLSNRALVETWPAPELERAREAAPPDMPEFPIVEVAVPAFDPAPLLVVGLRDALARAAEADRARDPASGAPIVFSLRAAPDVRWDRILRAIYAAALVGYSEPWLVVVDGAGTERTLRLSPEVHGGAVAAADSRETIRAALEALGPETGERLGVPEDPVAIVDEAMAMAAPTLALRLEEHGLRVRRGVLELSSDCRTPSSDGSPTFGTAALDRARLTICLGTIGAFERASFEADPDIAYGSALVVLDVLHAMGRPVSLVAAGSAP